ncbi:MAG TPA: hypothetical protein VHW74_12245 [Mycobacteriales bacterium]|jgi:hypothetical protein|nr:hypothetical protein [Mycobacteriales bacterium]
MSSVLSPVGSQPARVYWLRRLAVLGVPLILIIIVAVSCSGGSKKPSAGSNNTGGSPSSNNTSQTPDPCAPGDLSARVSASKSVYAPGDSPIFTGVLTNVSAASCRLTTSPSDENWTVTTGADRFWTTGKSAGCPRSDVASTKTLAPQASSTISITWDGKRLEPGCTSGDAAAVGEYVLHAKLDGVAAPQVVFAFHNGA